MLAPTRLLSVPDGRGGAFGLVEPPHRAPHRDPAVCGGVNVARRHPGRRRLGQPTGTPGLRPWATCRWCAGRGHRRVRARAGHHAARRRPAPDRPIAPADVQALIASWSPASPAPPRMWTPGSASPSTPTPRRIASGTWTPRGRGRPDPDGLESSLAACGVAVLGRATEVQLVAIVRTAFDPVARGDVDRVLGGAQRRCGLGGCRPSGAQEAWEHYRHDSGISVTWGWQEAPRQHVTSGVLTRLVSPARYVKRVTLAYRPLPAARRRPRPGSTSERGRLPGRVPAGAEARRVRPGHRRPGTGAPSRRARRRRAPASSWSASTSPPRSSTRTLCRRRSPTSRPAPTSRKIQLRRLYGAQAAAFATTLPCGASLPDNTMTSSVVAPRRGWPGAGRGRAAHVEPRPSTRPPPCRRAGCSPSPPAPAPPPLGVPFGRHMMWGEVVCLDPFAWLRRRPDHQPRRVLPRPARHRQVQRRQAASAAG